ncbi:MAG: hypothetical protein HYS86_04395 [Candidatus Chisholmbacteria bacterium]|nr:hypothetical protein [Candidatus Chisholmbacteria bacterium]
MNKNKVQTIKVRKKRVVTGTLLPVPARPRKEAWLAVIANDEDISAVVRAFQMGAEGIVFTQGTEASHGAIAAKELGLPVALTTAKDKLRMGSQISILEGGEITAPTRPKSLSVNLKFPPTKSPVSINLGFPEVLQRTPELKSVVDAIGFVRLEYMLLTILQGLHPLLYIRRFGEKRLAEELASELEILVATGLPVWIRTDDFSPQLLVTLKGGKRFETIPESNPMLGYRGIARSIAEPKMVRYQFRAIRILVKKGFATIGLFPPMTRTVSEYRRWLKLAREEGLTKQMVDFGLMVETVAAAENLAAFARLIEFVVIGSNDLTQFTMAIDRSHPKLKALFDVRQPSVKKIIGKIIVECKRQGIPCFIGGVAGTDPRVLLNLMEMGPIYPSVAPQLEVVARMRVALAKKGK